MPTSPTVTPDTSPATAGVPADVPVEAVASWIVELMWPVKPVLAFPADRDLVDGPQPFRLSLLDLVAAALPDVKAHLRDRGLREAGFPTWFVTTGRAAGLTASLDEVLVCRVPTAPIDTTLLRQPVTS